MNLDISPSVGIVSAIWLLLFLTGRWQLNRVKQMTTDLILAEGRKIKQQHQEQTVEGLYEKIIPLWEPEINKIAWFVLHKSELFPIPAFPKIVQKRLNFTPAWMGAYLQINGIHLPASAELKEQINSIISMIPDRKKKTTA
jgi:hypothetical protein